MSEALNDGYLLAVRELGKIEARIESAKRQTMGALLEIGRCLNEAKDKGLVPHGQFEAWAADQTGMGERTRQRVMQAAREVPAGSAMERLDFTKTMTLLALPEGDREDAAEKAEAENTPLRQLQEEVGRLTQRNKELEGVVVSSANVIRDKEAADKAARKVELELKDTKRKVSDAAAEVKSLKDQLAALKAKPAETPDDEDAGESDADTESIRREAREEAARELQVKITAAEQKAREAEEKAGELRRQLAVADPAVAKFGVLFAEVQELLNKMLGLIGEVAEPEKRDRLKKALAVVLEKYGEQAKEG